MAAGFQLQPGQDVRDAAQALLGDASLTDQVMVSNGYAFIKDVPVGPPAKWAADPSKS
jgi:hypothetical protein